MVEYKWVALSNTTIGVLMASINGTIILISLPAIFNGIKLNPLAPDAFQYLLWILFGYSIVTATLLVTFGRISDMFGRVRLYNLGFAIVTAGSILLYLTPGTGTTAGLELILFRVIQGVGAAFLFSNSSAIITDAFPHTERGKALGINQISALIGSLVGLILGGILSTFYWRDVFLVSVPVGIAGTAWSYLRLKEVVAAKKGQRIDVWGNITFALGLTILLIGVTYGLLPYGSSSMGWGNPWVVASIVGGVALLVIFPFVELKVRDPMFRLQFFKIRIFAAANLAALLGSIARGGVMILLIILLQGIWLPLHGYSYQSTPFWAGVYMIPMMAGFVVFGPLSGLLSDKYGSRGLATLGMLVAGGAFIALSTFNYNFSYLPFAATLFVMGSGMGLFAAPNTASIMNSVPSEHRGAASGMIATVQNVGQTISTMIFFTIIITSLAGSLPGALKSAVVSAGAPLQLGQVFASIPPTNALFAAFLGYNPVQSILSGLASNPQLSGLINSLSASTLSTLEGKHWFPTVIAPPFMSALAMSFYLAAALSFAAAVVSALRGRAYIHGLDVVEESKTATSST
ncbi:MAG: MFS transporter [Nitrososphaerales archaeon]|jgi:MFS family permease